MRTLLAGLLLLCSAQALTLVDHGKSDYTIVLSAQASPSEYRAAEELQRFVEQMSGARLPIATDDRPPEGPLVLLGDNAVLRRLNLPIPFDQLGPEDFLLQQSGRNLIITGGRQRGTMYGVYTFLDHLGCRWFTSEVSRIPKLPTIEVTRYSKPEIHRPSFEYREPFFTEAWDRDWAARNRTNGTHARLDASTGGKLQYFPFVHSFYQLVPPAQYFATHPEYFSLIGGKRRTERGQLCLTNPDVLRVVIARVEEWIREHPDATIFSVSQNDWEGWCECDRCRRVEQEEGGRHSGPLLRFVNAVAEEIGKRHPGKLIDTLAYWYTEDPPTHARPAPNVRIRLCPIGICVAHSFATCPRSAYFYRNLQAWSKITDQLYIWHYNTNFSQYLLPFPDFDELAADIPVYKNHGVVGLFMQGDYAPGGGGEASELRAYVLARQLWDSTTNVQQTVREFLQGVYGPAAPALLEYFEFLHSQVRGRGGRHLWVFDVPEYDPDFRTKAAELFARAEAAAPDDATRRRVLKAKLSLEYYGLLRDSKFEVNGGLYTPLHLDDLKARAADLFSRMRSFGIQSLHEGRTIDLDEKRYASLKSLSILTIENRQWRADIVPTFSARVIRLMDKSTGHDLLRHLPPGEGAYPEAAGQVTFAHTDYYSKALGATWTIEEQKPDRLVLLGTLEHGLRLRRVFAVDSTGLHTESIVENVGSAPQPAALEVSAEFDAGGVDAAAIDYGRERGQAIRKPLIAAGEEPTGKQSLSGADLPVRRWTLHRGDGGNVAVEFSTPQIARVDQTWTAKSHPGAHFTLWSRDETLAPGASLRVEAHYGR